MGDTNRVALKYIEETTWGTTPGTPTMKEIRMTGESLNFNIANITSNEIRSDRMVTDLVQTGAENSGGINGELSYDAYDEFIEGALWSDWSTALSIELTTISATATGFETTTASGFSTVIVGQWIKVAGFSASALNTYYQVTANSGTAITTAVAPSTTEAAGETVTMSGSYIRNGTTEHSYSIQRSHEDMSPVQYFLFAGMIINQMQFSVEAEAISTISFDFLGKSATLASTATASATTAAPTNDVMNGVADIENILEAGGVVNSALVKRIDFSVNNNLRGKKCIGTLGNADVGAGKIDITGSISAYFLDGDLYTKYLNGTETNISFRATDASGNAYIVTLPRIKFETDNVNAGGGDADVMEEISWRALRSSTYSCMIQIDKFAA